MGRGKRRQGAAGSAALAEIPVDEHGVALYGATSRRALGLDDPIAPLYHLPTDAPAPDEPLGADERQALGPVNAVREQFGYTGLRSLRGGRRSHWTRHFALQHSLESVMPRGARLRFVPKSALELKVPTSLDYQGYDEAVEVAEKLARGLGVELRRGPAGLPMAAYGGGYVAFNVPLPAELRDFLGNERAPGWQPPLSRPALPLRLLNTPLMGPEVKRKQDMYALYDRGAFGNKLPCRVRHPRLRPHLLRSHSEVRRHLAELHAAVAHRLRSGCALHLARRESPPPGGE